ncbi:MAG: ASKHA domain-containing protein [Elusimicrobiota bacterium]
MIITILPDNKQVEVKESTDLLTAIQKSGITVRSSCAGRGTCGLCKIILKEEKSRKQIFSAPTPWISKEEELSGYVLACQTSVLGDLTVEIPIQSRIEKIVAVGEKIYEPAESVKPAPERPEEAVITHHPLAEKIYLKLPQPTLKDNISDFDRIIRAISEIKKTRQQFFISLNLLKGIPNFLRKTGWKTTASVVEINGAKEIINLEQGDTSQKQYGIALDIGTTTVVAYLVDLISGRIVNSKASYNRQVSFGDDVISRIIYAENPEGQKKLKESVVETINSLINSVIQEKNISKNDILALQSAGNTTMIHLFLGINPEFIRKEPYIPSANFVPDYHAQKLGIDINPNGVISCLPGIASYVGGDITAGVLACGMNNFSTLSLLVDLGTNGEIVLGNKDWLISSACSAGPAFEGVGIKSGLRAVDGAIQSISVTPLKEKCDIKFTTIANKKPRGICGSGLIDVPAEFLRKKIIDRSGKFLSSPCVRTNGDGEKEFLIVPAEKSETGMDIVITEPDIANIIRSKGAIFLGIQVLLEEVGLKFENINNIYISGGFGTFLDVEKAITIGLLPDLPREKFHFIGNSSITGAKMCLLSEEARILAREIASKMTYIDLSVNPKFMNEYTSTLFLPHTDITLFPSLRGKL